MAQRTWTTERQRRLGAELRKVRTAAGVSPEHIAGLLGVDRGKISNFESGLRPISPERVRTWVCNCDCSDDRYANALVDMARPQARGWWEKYRGRLPAGLLDIAELEANSVRMRVSQSVHIPGLLQTRDHARSLFEVVLPRLPSQDTELRMALRMERQRILMTDPAPELVAIIHEAALRMRFGGRKVARAQLEHVLSMAERPNITVLALPVEAGAFPGAGQAIFYAEAGAPQLDTVQLDSSHGPEFLHGAAQLAKYRAHLDWMEKLSLNPRDSRDFIRDIAHRL
ncbi:helix-turn-helix domain-containing protein [Streptomyces orinoci]|uniref:Helix-turn-helix transcriptional regulator n=1 Tax=Streptomyces orinoci TaxID=67339 RepID=A0ABV3JTL3_STRON|nr:helix-turn-helix transcriptional regulator [Streptomyces orinoci]